MQPFLTAVYWFLLSAVLWAFFGYPLFMIARGRLRTVHATGSAISDGRRPGPAPGSASVILPLRNAETLVAARIQDIFAQGGNLVREVIVVCNGCQDRTAEVASALGDEHTPVRVLVSPAEEGKAGALNRGIAAAEGEFAVLADARQRYGEGALEALLAPFADPGIGAVSGLLRIGSSDQPALQGVRRYWAIETQLRAAESRTGSVVGATGAIYALRRELYRPLPAGLILDDVLTPMRIALAGHRVMYATEAVAYDQPAPDPRAEFRRKVRTLVGNIQILGVEPALLSPTRNPLFFRYLSHRVLRLTAPWFLTALVPLGFLLPWVPFGLLSSGLVALGIAGALGIAFPVRVLAVPAGFVLLNAAGVLALWKSRRPTDQLWN